MTAEGKRPAKLSEAPPKVPGKVRRGGNSQGDHQSPKSPAKKQPKQRADDFASDESDDDKPNLGAIGRRASLHSRSISPGAAPHSPTAAAHSPTTAAPVKRPRRASAVNDQPKSAQNQNVRVMVRVRPFSEKEVEDVQKAGGYMQSVIDMPRRDQVLLLDHKNEYEVAQGFNFDEVFWSIPNQKSNVNFSGQDEVYKLTGVPALAAAWDGINSCIFAYGQTGSGKTHTMMGDPQQIANPDGCDEELLGVLPRMCRDLFGELDRRDTNAISAGLRRKSDVRVGFYEIYNEKVKDLLWRAATDNNRFTVAGTTQKKPVDPEDLKIREHPTEGPYVEGVSIHNPRSYDDIIQLINIGNQERSVASTNLNDRSSRSHALFRITVTQTTFYDQQRVGIGGPKTTSSQRRSNINIVDLAGSENVKRSGVKGSELIEAQKINLSLTTLRRVIDHLIDKKPSIPYRDSTLTWLLREDLGGNAKTFMLATVSPHHSNSHESLRTLEYAMRARSIVNHVRVNEDETAKMLADLEKKMIKAQEEMRDAHSAEEVREIEQRMAEADKAKKVMVERLDEASAEVNEYKEKLEAEKEKNMAFAFRHAVMLRAAKLRLSNAESQQAELSSLKAQMAETGHSNMEELTMSLRRERGKAADLERRSEELEREKEELERKHMALLNDIQNSEASALAERAARAASEEDSKKREKEMKDEIEKNVRKTSDRYDLLLEQQKRQLAEAKRAHEEELRGIIRENQYIVEEFQQQMAKEKLAAQEEADNSRQQLRSLEQTRAEQQKYLHEDIKKREEMIDRLDAELAENTRLKEKYHAELKSLQSTSERERAELVCDASRRYDTKMSELSNGHAAEVEHLKTLVRDAEDETYKAKKDKEASQRFFQDILVREEKYSTSYDHVMQFLNQLPADGEVPSHWGIEDFRKMVKAFHEYRRDYCSYRPNKDTLKAMLRVNPSSRAASRLEDADAGVRDDKSSLQVIMGGMKVPELAAGAPPKLAGEKNEDDDKYDESVAAHVPYSTELSALNAKPIRNKRKATEPRISTGTDSAINEEAKGTSIKKKSSPRHQKPKALPQGKVRGVDKPTSLKAPRQSTSH